MQTAIDQTVDVLRAMLTENTGRALCDSGGTPKYDEHGEYVASDYGYGRHWERNQRRNFDAEPATVLSFKYGIEVTHNVYHWLADRLEHDADMHAAYERFCAETDPDRDQYPLQLMEEFPGWLADQGHEIGGMYGDGSPFTVNTYNGEDLLSQTLQFLYFTCDGTPYVLLQIHGGCDVRGGYTRPVAFRENGMHELGILDNARATIYCEPRSDDDPNQLGLDGQRIAAPDPHYWSTDDASHWYADGACGCGAGTELQEYDRREIDSRDDWESGVLCIDADGNGYCPICGGRLIAGT